MTSAEANRPRALLAEASRRWVRLLPWFVAFVLCVALLPTTIQVLSVDYGLDAGIASALAVAQAAPLLLAVVYPLRAWFVIFAADVGGALVLLTVDLAARQLWPFPPMQIVGYVALCLALGLRQSRRTLALVWLATAAAGVGLRFAAPDGTSDTSVLFIVLSGVALVLGAALRERSDAQRRLAEQETISEAERDRRTLLEERTRIARELHDVVAHGMSVIHVQATTAQYRIGGLDEATIAEFSEIAASARSSIAEMRRLLGVLRDEETTTEFAPQPGLDGVPALVASAERAGIPVSLTVSDAAANSTVPQTIGLAAYRIVQEALSNVIRHAPGSPTTVRIERDADDLIVHVENTRLPEIGPLFARRVPLGTSDTGGHGLVGIRERVALLGGRTSLGPTDDGGYRVEARLPFGLEESASSPEPSGE